jgi:phosphoribosylformylglycinamidine cyclo-ligase
VSVPAHLSSNTPGSPKRDAYARAGVDLGARNDLVERIKQITSRSRGPEVLSAVGPFCSLVAISGYREPVIASSTDGVGTKLRIAMIMDRYDTVGQDLVNHCVNDILTSGADPKFFLDYIGSSAVPDERKLELIGGMKAACDAHDCAFVGGETADMPDIYAPGDFDLVGFITGAVEREHVIDAARVREGDVLLALPSSGLHTNGYSLVRRIFGIGVGGDVAADRAVLDRYHEDLGATLGDALLAVHRSYYAALKPVLTRLHAIAHITGGGIIDNVPRVLPEGVAARIDLGSWAIPPLFTMIQREGGVSDDDMYHTFNMGLGVIVAVDSGEAEAVAAQLDGAMRVGAVVKQSDERRVIVHQA